MKAFTPADVEPIPAQLARPVEHAEGCADLSRLRGGRPPHLDVDQDQGQAGAVILALELARALASR